MIFYYGNTNRCRDTHCLPSMKAAQEGEDEDVKKARRNREAEVFSDAALTDIFDRSVSLMVSYADDKDDAQLAAEDAEYDRCVYVVSVIHVVFFYLRCI